MNLKSFIILSFLTKVTISLESTVINSAVNKQNDQKGQTVNSQYVQQAIESSPQQKAIYSNLYASNSASASGGSVVNPTPAQVVSPYVQPISLQNLLQNPKSYYEKSSAAKYDAVDTNYNNYNHDRVDELRYDVGALRENIQHLAGMQENLLEHIHKQTEHFEEREHEREHERELERDREREYREREYRDREFYKRRREEDHDEEDSDENNDEDDGDKNGNRDREKGQNNVKKDEKRDVDDRKDERNENGASFSPRTIGGLFHNHNNRRTLFSEPIPVIAQTIEPTRSLKPHGRRIFLRPVTSNKRKIGRNLHAKKKSNTQKSRNLKSRSRSIANTEKMFDSLRRGVMSALWTGLIVVAVKLAPLLLLGVKVRKIISISFIF